MTVVTDKIQNHAGGPVEFVGQVAAKVWANYDGVNAAVRDSFNVSSLIDNGLGSYTYNTANAMSNEFFGIALGGMDKTGTANTAIVTLREDSKPTASTVPAQVNTDTGASIDTASVTICTFGDLAQ